MALVEVCLFIVRAFVGFTEKLFVWFEKLGEKELNIQSVRYLRKNSILNLHKDQLNSLIKMSSTTYGVFVDRNNSN